MTSIENNNKTTNIQKPLRIAVLGYADHRVGTWDPEIIEEGIPGSEEAVIYASQELARRGHTVHVYMNPPTNSKWRHASANPRWKDASAWDEFNYTERYELVMCWRRTDFLQARTHGGRVFYWSEDSPFTIRDVPPQPVDALCMLTRHHYRQHLAAWHPLLYKIPRIISGNGIVPEQFPSPGRATNRVSVGYYSNYSRGLAIVLDAWPAVHARFPQATLDICYGRQTWGNLSPEETDKMVARIQELGPLGVVERGKIGHLPLAELMSNTSVWAYPCTTTAETFCIVATKVQAAGMIPVVTRIGALEEVVHPEAPSIFAASSETACPEYTKLLLETLERVSLASDEDLAQERLKYVQFALKFSWAACVDKWLDLYNDLESKKAQLVVIQ